MPDQIIIKNLFEDQIVEEVAKQVAEEMATEIDDEVAVWIEKLPITSPCVKNTDITRIFQERFAAQLVARQDQITESLILRRRQQQDLQAIPAGAVRKEIQACEARLRRARESSFVVHLVMCALLASRIERGKKAFEKVDEGVVERVESEMGERMRREGEMWMSMGRVSEEEFETEWEEKFGREE